MARRAAMEWPDILRDACCRDFVSAASSESLLASAILEVKSISFIMEKAMSNLS